MNRDTRTALAVTGEEEGRVVSAGLMVFGMAQPQLRERLTALEATVEAANLLAGIPIQEEDRCTPYSSADYAYPQMLEAQIVPETGGRIYSPYTGETFTRADEVDIEHIVARSEAHDSGLCAADSFTRLAFASDMLNLTFADPQVNRDQKAAKDVADWLPEMNQCWFVNRVVAVKRRYGLSMDAREAVAALSVLESCSSFAMVVVDRGATVTPTPEASEEADPLSLYDTNGNGRITCAEARQHGIAPVHRTRLARGTDERDTLSAHMNICIGLSLGGQDPVSL